MTRQAIKLTTAQAKVIKLMRGNASQGKLFELWKIAKSFGSPRYELQNEVSGEVIKIRTSTVYRLEQMGLIQDHWFECLELTTLGKKIKL